MMPDFKIIEARPYHCGQMARILRVEHQLVVAKIGINSHQELRFRFDDSAFRRAWLVNGKLTALGGVTGSKASAVGYIWLAFAGVAVRYPVQIIKEARRQLAEIMITKRMLFTTILEGDDAAKRFAIFLGFVPADQEDQNAATSRFGRKELVRRFDNNTEARIAIGNGYAIAMRYDHEEAA